jgi:hypothetical protein
LFARYEAREDAVIVAEQMARARSTDCVVHFMDGNVDDQTGTGKLI